MYSTFILYCNLIIYAIKSETNGNKRAEIVGQNKKQLQ